MALHIWKISIEYNEHPGDWPITVTVSRSENDDKEFYGKKLKPLLSKAAEYIAENDEGTGNEL